MKTLRIARTTDVATFDPLRYNDLGTGEVLNRMYSHLVVTDNADRYVYSPLVAEVRRSRAGARARYLMRLRDDALWHDGLPVTAADVELTISRVLAASDSPRRPDVLACGHDLTVRAIDQRTVRIEFAPAGGVGLPALAWFPVLPGHLHADGDRAAPSAGGPAPVGSGQFRFGSYDPEDGTVTLQANQAHWSPPRLDSVRWQRVPDSAAAVESVLRGESDIATSVPPSLAAAVNGSPGVVVHARSSGNITYLGFNTASEPLRERAVRACLAHAIDRRRIVDAVLAGHGTLTQTLVHPRSEWHCPETEDYGYDPRAAAEALEQAGWRRTASGARADPHGRVLSLSLLTVRGDDMKQDAARLVARQLAEVGVTVRLESAAMAELLNDRVYPRCYEMVLLALNPGPSPSFLRAFYHSGGGADPGNRFGYANPAVDDLIDALPPLDESRAARAMVQDIQRLVARDVPHVPLFYADVVDVAASRLILPRLDALFGNRFYDLYQWDVMDPNPTSGQG